MKSKIVIYYDGVCFVCSSAINALIKMDKNNILYFSPLQSNYAKSSINKKFLKEMDCLLYTSPSPRDRTRSRMPSSA